MFIKGYISVEKRNVAPWDGAYKQSFANRKDLAQHVAVEGILSRCPNGPYHKSDVK